MLKLLFLQSPDSVHCLLDLAISWRMFYIQFVCGMAVYIMGNLNYVDYFFYGGRDGCILVLCRV